MSLRGAVDAFPLDMVLQLLAATDKTGQLEVRADGVEQRGLLGISNGRLASAQFEDEDGHLALGAVFAIAHGDFEFLPQDRIERADLAGDVEELLERARTESQRILAIRAVITSDRVRFRLSERATERGEITLGPEQWRALLLIDGERDVAAIAGRLGMRRLGTQQLLADLVRAGLIDTIEPPVDEAAEALTRPYRRLPPMQPMPPTNAGEPIVIRGRLPDFPLETIVQLLAETRKTGRLEVRAGRESSTLSMSDGRLVAATWGEEEGDLALGAAFTAQEGEFDFVPMADVTLANLSGGLDALLDRAAGTRDRIVAIRTLIPNERSRFTLSDRATRNLEIVLTPEQWRVLLGVNGERDVAAIADHLRMRRLPVMMVLADLVRGGYVDVLPAAEQAWPAVERRRTPWPTPPTSIDTAVETPAPTEPHPTEVEAPAPEEPPPPISRWYVDEPVAEPSEPVAEAPAETPAEPVAPEPETPLTEAPPGHEPAADDRLALLSGLFGAAEPAPPPTAWEPPPAPERSVEAAAAEATAEALASAPQPAAPAVEEPREEEVDPRLAAFQTPAAEPAAPSWEGPAQEAPSWETPAPAWETPAPAWETPAPAWEAPAAEAPAPEAPALEGAATETSALADAAALVEATAPTYPPVAPAPAAMREKMKSLFARLFGGGVKPKPAVPGPIPTPAGAAAPPATLPAARPGQLGVFANELVAAYNSGQYGKGRVEHRMLSLIMRADEQADPIDRPIPVANDRIDVATLERDPLPDRQAVPYLAVLVRQIYDDAETALGKDRAKRGFRDVRDRLFGKDLSLLHAPEVAGRMPKT